MDAKLETRKNAIRATALLVHPSVCARKRFSLTPCARASARIPRIPFLHLRWIHATTTHRVSASFRDIY